MNVRPINDRLLIKRIAKEETTASGLHIPDNAKKEPQEGVVIAVGSGKVLEDGTKRPLDVAVGDRVLFSEFSGVDVEVEGEKVLMVREDEVLAIIE